MTPNFSPPNYLREAVQSGLDEGEWALLNFVSLVTWESKFWREKMFYEIFFPAKNCGANGGGMCKENGASQLHRFNFDRSGR